MSQINHYYGQSNPPMRLTNQFGNSSSSGSSSNAKNKNKNKNKKKSNFNSNSNSNPNPNPNSNYNSSNRKNNNNNKRNTSNGAYNGNARQPTPQQYPIVPSMTRPYYPQPTQVQSAYPSQSNGYPYNAHSYNLQYVQFSYGSQQITMVKPPQTSTVTIQIQHHSN